MAIASSWNCRPRRSPHSGHLMPEVLVQQEGTTHPLWPEPQADLTESRDPRLWDRVCTLLKDALQSPGPPFRVLFLFDESEVLKNRDRPALEALIKRARSRSWGAPLLPVLRNLPFLHLIDETVIPDLTEWMHVLLAGRVSDVIQIPENAGTPPETQCDNLRNRVTAIKDRLAALGAGAGHRPWRCALPADRVALAECLGPALAITAPDEDPSSDLLIVLDTSDPDEQIGAIERYLTGANAGDRIGRIITYMREPKNHLKRYCAEKGFAPPMSVGGDFELWYLLLRLNEHATDDHESVQAVALSETPAMRTSSPSILLTCAFGLNEAGQWLAAAEEVGELLHQAPRELNFRVELAITPERLYDVLEEVRTVAAWIHLGHGLGRFGLWVPGRGLVPPDRWSPCFLDRELRLALFMTCDSDAIARHFAEQGTHVAIGFKGEVQSTKARHLSFQVLKAMMTDGMRGESIIAGFRNGKSRFKSLQNLNAEPRAYYPRQR